MNKKIILCSQCKYFPNKADQYKHRSIRISPFSIQWRCDACGKANLYSSLHAITLPQSTLMIASGGDLLKSKENPQGPRLSIDIELESTSKREPLYYCPQFRDEIQKRYGIQLQHIRSMDDLEKQSAWLAQYHQFMRSFAKLRKKTCQLAQMVTLQAYVIYLLDVFTHRTDEYEGARYLISLKKGDSVFYFNIADRDTNHTSLLDFIKIYALLQFDPSQAWFLRLYTKLLQKYRTNERGDKDSSRLLMIDATDSSKRSNSYDQYKFVLRTQGKSECNIFSISPLGLNPFVCHIYQVKKTKAQSVIVFFKRQGYRGLSKKEVTEQLAQLGKSILLSEEIAPEDRQTWISKHLKADLRAHPKSKLKLIKLYAKFTLENQQTIVLLSFNWHKIERELLEEALDEEVEQVHQLKEDILREQFIKLQAPSPFLKKSPLIQTSESPQRNPQSDQEEYL